MKPAWLGQGPGLGTGSRAPLGSVVQVAAPLREAFRLRKPTGAEGVPKFPRVMAAVSCVKVY